MSQRNRLVVVGHGMVGHRVVEAAIERGLTSRWDIVVLAEEPRPAYDRVRLSSYFELADAAELSLLPAGGYDDPRVEVRLSCPVAGVDRARRVVLTQHGDNARTGANLAETCLTPAIAPSMHQLATLHVDGQLYAQPLLVSGVDVGGSTRDLLLAASTANEVTAFDARTLSTTPVWQVGQVVQVLRGAAQRRVAGDRDLDVAAHLQEVAGRVVAEGGVFDRARHDEGALAGLRDGQAHGLQGAERLPQHGPADLQGPAQLRFRGELVPHGVLTALDGAAQVAEHRFHRADAPRNPTTCLAV